MAETSLGILMKEIGEALKFDDDNLDKEAFVKYTSCIHKIAGNLVLGINLSGGNVVISPITNRHVKLLQQCVDRVVALVCRMESHQSNNSALPANASSPQTTPPAEGNRSQEKGLVSVSSKVIGMPDALSNHHTTSNHGSFHSESRAVSFHVSDPELPPESNPYHYQKQKMPLPMEIAHKQNQSLLTVYKARMQRLNKSDVNAYNYSLTIQRKMAENIAIARAQEEQLALKMKARQQRLEEEAARRFTSTGISSEEQEQRQMYKNILMYENEVDFLQKWRKRFENNPEDPIQICQLVQEVLRCRDHPLTAMLHEFQFKVYRRLHPLVSSRQTLDVLLNVKVDLPKHLWPSKQEIADLLQISTPSPAPTISKKRKSRNRGKSDTQKSNLDVNFKETESLNSISASGNKGLEKANLMSKSSKKYVEISKTKNEDSNVDFKKVSSNRGVIVDQKNTMTTKRSESIENGDYAPVSDSGPSEKLGSLPCQCQGNEYEVDDINNKNASPNDNKVSLIEWEKGRKIDLDIDDSVQEKEKCGEPEERSESIEDEENGSDTNTLTSLSDSDSDCDECEGETKGIYVDVANTKHDLKTAMDKGNQLESELTLQRKQAQLLMKQVAKDFEDYDVDFDDLFDDEDEAEVEEKVKGRAGSENTTEMNSYKPGSSASMSLSSRPSTLEKKPDVKMNRSQSLQPVHIDTPTEPPPSMFQSLPHMPSSDDNNEEDKEQIILMKHEAYARHLKAITDDIHSYLHKLLGLMIIAYEDLDTPIGKDQCAVTLEEPFFKPIWAVMLRLFRLVNHKEEVILACVMTSYADATPKDLKISKKFWLCNEFNHATSHIPYGPAIEELKRICEHYTVLGKLDCIVKVCRLICECVDNYYAEKDNDPTFKSSKKAPGLGADDLLPLFAYVVIRSKTPQIVSECYAMLEFIQESYMMGEEGYCLTTLRTAIAYVMSLYNEIIC